jgi:hypothetical protein
MCRTVWIVIAVLVLALVGAAIWMAYTTQRRSAALGDRFGPRV